MNQVVETILHRRAIRRFEPEQIGEETLQQILQAGLYAPSAGGRQCEIQPSRSTAWPLPSVPWAVIRSTVYQAAVEL